ncbi:hypothetical protein K7432_005242 [Basidiobolus ranarum]|uniref:F-box domain-containing protein n=1 Tax=Basidiobolus ranarum TaxID=34480 RepID=A0ABR2W4E5_9FUNG
MSTPLILDLPPDCWYGVFTFLSIDEILNVSLLCKTLYKLLSSQENSLWRTQLTTFLPGLTKDIHVVSGLEEVNSPSSKIKYLRLGVPGALRNVTPESPLGWKYPSIPRFNTARNFCLLLRKIKRIQDDLVESILRTQPPVNNAGNRNPVRNVGNFTKYRLFLEDQGERIKLLDLIELEEKFNLTLPLDYVYFLLHHAHKFWWNPEWLRLSHVSGAGSFVFTGPKYGQINTLNEFQVITSERLLEHNPSPYLGELVESQYDYWKYIAGERRFLRITFPRRDEIIDESERYLMLEVTDFTESDYGSVYYVNNEGDAMQVRDFDEEDYMPRTPLWSHFTFTDLMLRFEKVNSMANIVPYRFLYQTGFHDEFKNFLEETEIFDKPQMKFTTKPSCLYVTNVPFSLSEKEIRLEKSIPSLNIKERKCTCQDDSD